MTNVPIYSGFKKKATLTPELFSAIVGALAAPTLGAALIEPSEQERWYTRMLKLLGLSALGGGLGYAGGKLGSLFFGTESPQMTPTLAALGLLTTTGAGAIYGAAAIERARRKATEQLLAEMEEKGGALNKKAAEGQQLGVPKGLKIQTVPHPLSEDEYREKLNIYGGPVFVPGWPSSEGIIEGTPSPETILEYARRNAAAAAAAEAAKRRYLEAQPKINPVYGVPEEFVPAGPPPAPQLTPQPTSPKRRARREVPRPRRRADVAEAPAAASQPSELSTFAGSMLEHADPATAGAFLEELRRTNPEAYAEVARNFPELVHDITAAGARLREGQAKNVALEVVRFRPYLFDYLAHGVAERYPELRTELGHLLQVRPYGQRVPLDIRRSAQYLASESAYALSDLRQKNPELYRQFREHYPEVVADILRTGIPEFEDRYRSWEQEYKTRLADFGDNKHEIQYLQEEFLPGLSKNRERIQTLKEMLREVSPEKEVPTQDIKPRPQDQDKKPRP